MMELSEQKLQKVEIPGSCEFEIARLRPPNCELYLLKDLEPSSKLYYHFLPREKTWELVVIQVVHGSTDLDIKAVKKRIRIQLREWSPPSIISLVQLLETPGQVSPVYTELEADNSPYLSITHSWSQSEVLGVLGHPSSSGSFPKEGKIPWFLILFLILCFILQSGLEFFLPGEHWVVVLGVNRLNFYQGNYFSLLGGTFLHGGGVHLILNLLALHYLGGLCSRFYSSWKLLILYFFSACTGALASIAFLESTSVGASGAIFGLAGAGIAGIICHRAEMNPFFSFQHQKTLKGLWVLLALNAVLPFLVPRIDVWGHLGGFSGGILLGFFFSLERSFMRRSVSILCLICFTIALGSRAQFKSKEFILKLEAREREQRGVLDWMNTRLLPIERKIQVLLVHPVPRDPRLLGDRLGMLKSELGILKEQRPPKMIQTYLEILEEGLELSLSEDRTREKVENWNLKIEEFQKKLMETFGLKRKS
ncbi:rhomboid family intramembrane serine protease [bacterium]|jgi:membrane associated rhomboid family serine protease|nr:rhomboid family intramembrane serine protease [bacterium]